MALVTPRLFMLQIQFYNSAAIAAYTISHEACTLINHLFGYIFTQYFSNGVYLSRMRAHYDMVRIVQDISIAARTGGQFEVTTITFVIIKCRHN